MAITISENHFYQIKTALSNLASYLDEKAETDQEAAEHLAETEETCRTFIATSSPCSNQGYSKPEQHGAWFLRHVYRSGQSLQCPHDLRVFAL